MSTSPTTAKSRLLWLLSEGFVVFIGVAAALVGQAWFEERADRRIERELLSNVLAEARDNASLYDGLSEELWMAELIAFAALLDDDTPESFGLIAQRAPVLLNTHGSGLLSAALDEALQAGNLRLVQDPSLRSELAAYRDVVRRVFERFDDHQDWTNSSVRSFLMSHGIAREAVEGIMTEPAQSTLQERGAALAASQEFEGIVREQIFLHVELFQTMTSARTTLELRVTWDFAQETGPLRGSEHLGSRGWLRAGAGLGRGR